MATIVTIQPGDQITSSRADLNTNFANLNADKIETSVLDTDTALTANSDAKIATQKAVKAYVDTGGNVNASTTAKGIVEIATDAEAAAGTVTGATGAPLVLSPSNLANKAKVTVSKSATQALTAGSTAQITFNTEDVDTGGDFASNQFTAPRTGTYLISLAICIDSVSASATQAWEAEVRLNGTAILRGVNGTLGSAANIGPQISLTALRSLTAADVLTVYSLITGANGTILSGTNTKFTILEV